MVTGSLPFSALFIHSLSKFTSFTVTSSLIAMPENGKQNVIVEFDGTLSTLPNV